MDIQPQEGDNEQAGTKTANGAAPAEAQPHSGSDPVGELENSAGSPPAEITETTDEVGKGAKLLSALLDCVIAVAGLPDRKAKAMANPGTLLMAMLGCWTGPSAAGAAEIPPNAFCLMVRQLVDETKKQALLSSIGESRK